MNPPPLQNQEQKDVEHLKLLRIFHIVMGCFGLLGICGVVAHGAFFAVMIFMPSSQTSNDEIAALFPVLVLIYGFLSLLILAFALCNFLCARFLRERRRILFIQITAGINCLCQPLGTALGIFTFIVLNRPSVKALFAAHRDVASS